MRAGTLLGLRVKRPIVIKVGGCQRILVKFSNIKFNESPLIRCRVVTRGLTAGQTDTAKLMDAFCNMSL
jgi:hypothetical protein